jgi:hypothetical protein
MNLEDLIKDKQDLHEDLRPYVEVGSYFPMIKHPLIFSIPYLEQMNPLVNMQYKQKKELVKKALKQKDYDSYIWLHERPFRLNAFTDIKHKLKSKQYWSILSDIWRDSENIWQNKPIWLYLFLLEIPNREYFMSLEDRAAFNNLPNEIIVYRGYDENNKSGYSYTLDRKKAEWFARRFDKNGKVLKRKVKKEDIFAYTNQRGENEVIILK